MYCTMKAFHIPVLRHFLQPVPRQRYISVFTKSCDGAGITA